MSVAAVNYYFRSKEDLYIEAVRHAARACEQHTPIPNWPPGVSAETQLRGFIQAFLLRLLRSDVPAWHRLLIMRELAEPRPGACEAFVHDYVQPTFLILQTILAELAPSDISPDAIRMIGSSIVGQCLHYHHARHVLALMFGSRDYSPSELERLTEHIWQFSLAGIRGMFSESAQRDH